MSASQRTCPVGAAEALVNDELMVGPPIFDENEDVAKAALRHPSRLNCHQADQTVHESQLDGKKHDGETPEETPGQRHQTYLHAEQGEVPNPDEWASVHFLDIKNWMATKRSEHFPRRSRSN